MIYPTAEGYLFRIVGRGTMHESPTVRDFIGGAMEDGAVVTLDLSECDYLDSTFLGCLVMLQRRGDMAERRFRVHAPDEPRQRLLKTSQIDRVLTFAETAPTPTGKAALLETTNLQRTEFCGHLLETHRALARLNGPAATMFQRIADQIARDLES